MNIGQKSIDLIDIPNQREVLPDYYKSRKKDAPFRLTALVVVILAIVLLTFGLLIWRFTSYLFVVNQSVSWIDSYLLLIVKAAPVLVIYCGVLWCYNKAQQSGIVRLHNDLPVKIQELNRNWRQVVLEVEETNRIWASNSSYRNLNTLDRSLSLSLNGGSMPLLTDNAAQNDLVSDQLWLNWIRELPHLMLAGKTNAGKTTLIKAIIAHHLNYNDQVVFLDPHDQPGKWFGVKAIGGGRDFDAILDCLSAIMAEMDSRYIDFNEGKKTEQFTWLRVVIDEVPALVAYAAEHRDKRWRQLASKLGSEARKVRISVALLTQSHLVENIGINSVLRENFSVIGLGDRASALLGSELDKDIRRDLASTLKGIQYPATIEYRNQVHILDTSNVDQLANSLRRVDPDLIWRPNILNAFEFRKTPKSSDQIRSEQVVDGSSRGSAGVADGSHTGQIALSKAQRETLAKILLRKGHTTRSVRDVTRLDNNRISELYGEVHSNGAK